MAVGLGFVVLVGLLGIACSREEQAFDTPPVIEMKGSQCLKEMDQSIDKYVMGNSSEAEVNQFWNCLGHAFQMFAKRTKGSEEGLYSAKELRNFLETFFLGEIRLSDDFLVEFMHLKRLFLGGSIQYVSLREIDESLVLFDKFRRLTLDLRPHIDLLNGTLYQNRIENHPEELDLALREFSKIVGRFFSLIEEAHQEYEFENFKNLLLEVIDLVKGEDELRRKLFVVQLVPLLSQLKNQLVGSPLDKILAHQWKPMAEILSEVFGLWIRYEHISYHKGWPQDERQRNLSILRMNDSIHRLGQWISQTDEDLDWIELEDMLEKIDGILYLRSGESSIEKLRNLLPLAGELKTQLVGGDKNRVAPFEWPLLIHRLGQILEIKMAWTYLVRPFSWNEGFGFLQLNRIAHLGLGVIEEVL
ncbi:MAG: hypothetical protein KDD35_07445, partial [Bdellovibrionales bacterium]|nr:hypothetical protein [Bdellovibrionales bacterium]